MRLAGTMFGDGEHHFVGLNFGQGAAVVPEI